MKDENLASHDEESTRELLHTAGARPSVPPDDLAAIRNAARTVWRARFVREEDTHAWRRWMLPLAAVLFAALVLVWWIAERAPADPQAPLLAARVESTRGSVPLSVGQPLFSGAIVETSENAWLSLRLAGGQSLRLDEHSRVRMVSAEALTLERGGVYLDSANRAPVTIGTVAGDFLPAGTQFELRLLGDRVQLRVREGRVLLEPKVGSDPAIVRAGEELLVREDGTLLRGQIGRSDPGWDWVLAAVQVPDIEGRTLQSFLDWITRERGWDLEFDSSEAALLSREVILHGSVSAMTPDEALKTVMLSSGFSHQIANGTLVVSRP